MENYHGKLTAEMIRCPAGNYFSSIAILIAILSKNVYRIPVHPAFGVIEWIGLRLFENR